MAKLEDQISITSQEVSICFDSSSTSSSNQHLACRICQSETGGTMVRPCNCAGTMANIHENCLNEWVSRSRQETCEICKEAYARTSRKFRSLREWTKPTIKFRHCLIVASICCLIWSLFNVYLISVERKFFERVFLRGYPPRGGDTARLFIALILLIMLMILTSILYGAVGGYLARQRIVRFTNNPNQSKK